ncbi:hypothetical protein ACIBI9_53350 [Nonomuraea sp. NPDC050451]|uniref:hypothetical protein n=1 Tax=Nonomuraea sp. NPDC050451 TaxID=3364364 RepID=UPI0037A17D1B
MVGPPKSAAGCRVVALDAETVRVLTRHRERQEQLSATAGTRWRDSGYVFTTAGGEPLRPDYLTGRIRRLVAAHRSGCTTCGTAPPPSRWPRTPT